MRSVITAAMVVGIVGLEAQAQDPFILSCQTFAADLTATNLASRFGSSNVSSAQVYVGEGFYEPGIVVFPHIPEQRAEFTRRNSETGGGFSVMRIRGDKSKWRTPEGLTLGLSLEVVERLNRRPFRLRGFGWDYGGTTTGWSGGQIARAELPECAIWARLFPEDDNSGRSEAERRLIGQVEGEREFSSGHPGMQAARAQIRIMGLAWTKAPQR